MFGEDWPEAIAAREAAKDITPSIHARLFRRLKQAGISTRASNVIAAYISDPWHREVYGPHSLQEQVEWIATRHWRDILAIPGIGKKSLQEIKDRLEVD